MCYKSLYFGLQVLENIKMKQIENYHKATTDAEKAMVVTDPLKVFHGAVENCKPLLILKTIVKGGSGYRVREIIKVE